VAWLGTIGNGELGGKRIGAEMWALTGTAGRGGARRPSAAVERPGCAVFAGIVGAHFHANVSTAILNFKQN
jgi:hypothetical protein